MRLVAFIVLFCMAFITSAPVLAQPAAEEAHACCKQMDKNACHKEPQKNKNRGCDMPGCAMMFTCSICGFFAVDKLGIKKVYGWDLQNPVAAKLIGAVSAYHSSFWKPPCTC